MFETRFDGGEIVFLSSPRRNRLEAGAGLNLSRPREFFAKDVEASVPEDLAACKAGIVHRSVAA